MNALTPAEADAPRADRPLHATTVLPDIQPLAPLSPAERSDFIERVYDQYCRILEAGGAVDPDAFCARFPLFQTSLRRLLDVHRNLKANPDVPDQVKGRWPESGEEVFGFRLFKELGRGAFARVYLAREWAVGNRLVAVKLSLHDDCEADTLGKLQHPNVVPIYSAQYDIGTGYTAVCMPFLGGATLCDLLDHVALQPQRPTSARVILEAARDERWPGDGAPPPARALQRGGYLDGVVYLGQRLADALAYIHARRILHRDLKPSNVLLCPNGEPVLLDFNLAMDSQLAEHRLGGTLPYMPPEQLEAMACHGLADQVPANPQTDLYALGVILYELLAGAHPFGPVPLKFKTQEARGFLLDRQQRGPRPLRELNPAVDADLAALILRCIARNPAERPASARELADALLRYQEPLDRVRRWVVRHTRAIAVASVLAVGVAGYGGYEIASLPPAAVRYARNGEELFRNGEYAQAVQAFSGSLQAEPDQPEVHFKRGRAYQRLGGPDGWQNAIVDYKAALEQAAGEQKGRIHACIGYCLNQLKIHHTAEDHYTKAIEAGFATREVYNDLAYTLLYKQGGGGFGEALKYATDALNAGPPLQAAYNNRAQALIGLLGQGQIVDPAQAVDDMRQVLMYGPGTKEQFHRAAWFCARVLHDRGHAPDDPLREFCIDCLKRAIEQGFPADQLKAEPMFQADTLLNKYLAALPNGSPVNPNPPITTNDRLVDPLHGLTE
jgi:serine/threonine protein kinase